MNAHPDRVGGNAKKDPQSFCEMAGQGVDRLGPPAGTGVCAPQPLQFRPQGKQPGPAVGPLKRLPGWPGAVGQFDREILGRQLVVEQVCRSGLGCRQRLKPQHSHEQPVHVHGGVPVVAAKESRMERDMVERPSIRPG